MRTRSSILVVSLCAILGISTLFYVGRHEQANKPKISYEGILMVRVGHSSSGPDQQPKARGPVMAVRDAVFDAFVPFAQSPVFIEQAKQRTQALNPDLKPCPVTMLIREIPGPTQNPDFPWRDRLYCVSGQGKDDEYVRRYVDSLMDEIVSSCGALRHAAREEFITIEAGILKDKIKALRASQAQNKPDELLPDKQRLDDFLKAWQQRLPALVNEIQLADAQFLPPTSSEPETLGRKYQELRNRAFELFADYCGGGPVAIMERAKVRAP